MPIHIVADENIPFVEEAFNQIGTVRCYSGREINTNDVKNADILLVRSVTKVNGELLHKSAIKIIGSVTIGTDHIDLDYLTQKGIAFTNAAGSNANSVAEYVMAAILELAIKYGYKLSNLTLGIVGVGNIGKIVKKMALSLGISVLLNDPPLARQTGDLVYRNLDELMRADIITLHVPLTNTGGDKTFHLFDADRMKTMKKNSVLINTSRGAVVDNQALEAALITRHLSAAVLDVWENEPNIDQDLLKLVEIGTPHIAGYSLDGKVNGTYQIYQYVCKHLNIEPIWQPKNSLPSVKNNTIHLTQKSKNLECDLASVIRNVYAIRNDDVCLRKMIKSQRLNPIKYFDKLRKEYPARREFPNYRVICPKAKASVCERLKSLGFKTDYF